MDEEAFLEQVERCVGKLGGRVKPGGSLEDPPLEVLRTYSRRVRWSWVPGLGRAVSVTAVVRQPVDLGFDKAGCKALLERVTRAIDGQVPFFGKEGGLAVLLSVVVLTPEPISPEDDGLLQGALEGAGKGRVVPLGWFRVNLGQEAVAIGMRRGPGREFQEPLELAEMMTGLLRRYVPQVEM